MFWNLKVNETYWHKGIGKPIEKRYYSSFVVDSNFDIIKEWNQSYLSILKPIFRWNLENDIKLQRFGLLLSSGWTIWKFLFKKERINKNKTYKKYIHKLYIVRQLRKRKNNNIQYFNNLWRLSLIPLFNYITLHYNCSIKNKRKLLFKTYE